MKELPFHMSIKDIHSTYFTVNLVNQAVLFYRTIIPLSKTITKLKTERSNNEILQKSS